MSIFKIKKNFPKNSKFFCEFSKRIAYTYPMFNFPAQNHEIMAFLTLSQYFFQHNFPFESEHIKMEYF